jgi:ATP-dependent DNA helicase RecG
MIKEELTELIEVMRTAETDLSHVEAKRAERDLPKRIWETLSAFANTVGGGVIIFGLDEQQEFKATGVKDPKKLQQDLSSICSEMEPPLRPTISIHRIEGRSILVAEIPELDRSQKPCFYKAAGLTNGAFIRVGDGDRKLTSYEVQMLLANRGQPSEDAFVVDAAGLDALDPQLVSSLLTRLRDSESSHFRILDDKGALATVGAVKRVGSKLHPTLAGLLALGRQPQQFFPALRVTFVVYPTPRIGEPGPDGERFLDDQQINGPIPRTVGAVLDSLKRNMVRRAIIRGVGRDERWEYPELALREAVVNALVHRDLSAAARGTPVQVQMFPDRLQIMNPGGLFGPVTLSRLGEEGISAARNQTLMKLLEDIQVPGEKLAVCENRGSGIGAMMASLRLAGMSPPIFDDRLSSFAVTFPNHTLLDEATVTWLAQIGDQLTDTQRLALALMRHGIELNNQVLRQRTGLDSRVATRELQELVQRGLIRRNGTRRWTSYSLAFTNTKNRRRDRRREIIGLLETSKELSANELAEMLGLTPVAVRFWLARMRKERTIEPTASSPRSPNTRYRLKSSSRRVR